MTLGQRIQELRRQHNLSQEALGGALGVSRQAVSRWEMDGAVPEVDKLIAMAKLFGVSLNDLLQVEEPGGSPSPQPAPTHDRDRRIIRLLTALCALLALVSVLSLGATLHFRAQVLRILDPPTPPQYPVAEVGYHISPNHEAKTFDLALRLTLEDENTLSGWEPALTCATYMGSGLAERQELQAEVSFLGGTAHVLLEDVPFRYQGVAAVWLTYETGTGAGAVTGAQPMLRIQPTGPGLDWNEKAIEATLPVIHEPELG